MARGQIYNWSSAVGGLYQTSSNWNPAGPPVATGTVRFNLGNSYTVNFGGNASAARLEVMQGDVTFNLGGFSYQITTGLNNLLENTSGGTAVLRLKNGSFSTAGLPVGSAAGSAGHLVLESGAIATLSSSLLIGSSGTGHLSILQGGQLTSGQTRLAANLGGNAAAIVSGGGSTWNITNNVFRVGEYGEGAVTVTAGGTLNAQDLVLASQNTGAGSLIVSGIGSQVTLANSLIVGLHGNGELSLNQGGKLTANSLHVGEFTGSNGAVHVNGAGSVLTVSNNLFLGSFNEYQVDQSVLNISGQGTVIIQGTAHLASDAVVNVTGGTWKLNSLAMAKGAQVQWSAGTIEFAQGATVSDNYLAALLGGSNSLSAGQILQANGGTLALDRMLNVAGKVIGADVHVNNSLAIQPLGKVSASGSLQIASGSSVYVAGLGALEVGAQLQNDGLLILDSPLAKVDGYLANNFGTLEGTGRVTGGMSNGTFGTVRALAGEHLIVQGLSTNLGNLELSGGTLEFTNTLSNLASGSISGRGEFRGGTESVGSLGVSNLGVMMFSGGTTDIRGDVLNTGNGRIVTAGSAITTFYDDVTHNGAEIRTNLGARTVFFGAQSGAGSFTGGGVVEYNGDLRPGNSPSTVYYEGDVLFSDSARLLFELGGIFDGEYDRLSITGDVFLAGRFELELLDGFQPLNGQSFLLVEKRSPGSLDGSFLNISEGDLLTWAGSTFVASYVGGDGNDFTLTAIPEPVSCVLAGLGMIGLLLRRSTRRHSSLSQ